jgi:lysophospholipase L1-like esterase
MDRKRYIIFSLITILGGMLITGLLFEVVLRLKFDYEQREFIKKYDKRRGYSAFAADADPQLIYKWNPQYTGINSQKYFDEEHKFQKQEGVFRIVIIGDSVAAGQGVLLRESFGKRLEAKLNATAKNAKCEVIILAVTGYSMQQEMIILQREAFRYGPDIIVWSYTLNDPADPLYHDAAGEIYKKFFRPKIHIVYAFKRALFVMREDILGRHCDKDFHRFLHCVYWANVEKNIKKIGELSRIHKVPVIFLIHPVLNNVESFYWYPYDDIHNKLAQTAEQAGLAPVDVLRIYRLYKPEEFLLNPNDPSFDQWHPNVKGHEVIAEYLYEGLRDYLKLPAK